MTTPTLYTPTPRRPLYGETDPMTGQSYWLVSPALWDPRGLVCPDCCGDAIGCETCDPESGCVERPVCHRCDKGLEDGTGYLVTEFRGNGRLARAYVHYYLCRTCLRIEAPEAYFAARLGELLGLSRSEGQAAIGADQIVELMHADGLAVVCAEERA